MINLFGSDRRYCDGLSRRSFLRIGGLAMGGLALPDLLRAEERAGVSGSHKAVIMVYLPGGMSHHDTFDLKPDAPAEVRGEFRPIPTSVPGIRVCELLPEIAKVADKLAIVRSIVGLKDEHSSWQNLTGFPMSQAQREDRPHFGSVISRVQGSVDPVVPPFVDLFPTMQHKPYNSAGGGFLGQAYRASKLGGGDDLELTRQTAVAAGRFDGRRRLLDEFDGLRRSVEGASVEGMDAHYRRAFEVLASDKVSRALDVGLEDPRIRDRYGRGSAKHVGDAGPAWNEQLLIARRLVEAGARCVSVAYGFWDTHGSAFAHFKAHLPLFDRGIAALVEDIHMRGLDKDVTVVVWGEFGRTPKINATAGRDHWSPVSTALLAGGGMKVGQVIGSTDKLGGYAVASPIHYQDVLATVYHNLGIDPHAFVTDPTGRPVPILPGHASPIAALA